MAVKIYGGNMTEASRSFNKLADFEYVDPVEKKSFTLTKEEQELLRGIDENFEFLSSQKVNALVTDEKGRVIMPKEGYYIHRIPEDSSEDEIRSRKEIGLVPVERFGLLESAFEAMFCLSVTESNDMVSDSVPRNRFLRDGNGQPLKFTMFDITMSIIPAVGFIIDKSVTNGSLGARQLDMFSYIKKNGEYKTNMNLSQQEKAILDFIVSCSKKANNVVNGMYSESYDIFNWRTITGGVSSNFVVGVCINPLMVEIQAKKLALSRQITQEEAENLILETAKKCSNIFSVPVVESTTQRIIYSPENEKNKGPMF